MQRRRATLVTIALAVVLFGATLIAWLGTAYQRDLRAHAQRLASGSRLLEAACGQIEYAESGVRDGPPLLIVHGSGGGFDQGLTLGADYAARGFRIIAPSRFGYLRTPFPNDPSAEHQAGQFACLLDALGVPDAAVMGVSAGAVSALHFAALHPHRVRALALLVPAVYRPDPSVPMPAWALHVLDAAISADLPFWLFKRFAPDVVRRLVLATPHAAYAHAEAAEQERADALLEQIMPVSARRLGLLNDSRLTTGAARAPLEAIRAPTLCISARDDGFGTYASAQYTAQHIDGARFIGFEHGGHLLLGHQDEVVKAVEAWLQESSAAPNR